MVPANSSDMVYHDDWDALGMRASGSQSVSFQDVIVPERGDSWRLPGGRVGRDARAQPDVGRVSRCGVAWNREARTRFVLQAVARKRKGNHGIADHVMLASQNAIDIAAMRGIFDRAGRVIDLYYADHPADVGTRRNHHRVRGGAGGEGVHQRGVRACRGPCADAIGRAGYMNKHPLSARLPGRRPGRSCTRWAPTGHTSSSAKRHWAWYRP